MNSSASFSFFRPKQFIDTPGASGEGHLHTTCVCNAQACGPLCTLQSRCVLTLDAGTDVLEHTHLVPACTGKWHVPRDLCEQRRAEMSQSPRRSAAWVPRGEQRQGREAPPKA